MMRLAPVCLSLLLIAVACSPGSQPVLTAPQAIIGDYTFLLEIADTAEKRSRGLMGRTSLPPGKAMLFVFDQEGLWPFWMKGTLIPLDILWLNAEMEIVDIQTMHPEPGTPDAQLTLYRPQALASYALEMNAGLAQALVFTPGMKVFLEFEGTP